MSITDYFEGSEYTSQRNTTQTLGKRVRYLGPTAEINNCGKTPLDLVQPAHSYEQQEIVKLFIERQFRILF